METVIKEKDKNVNHAWEAALAKLRANLRPPTAFDTFIAPLSPMYFDEKNHLFYLSLRTNVPYIEPVIKERYVPIISSALSSFYDKSVSPIIMLSENVTNINPSLQNKTKEKAYAFSEVEPSVSYVSDYIPEIEENKKFYSLSPSLLPQYSFDNFIVDDKNRFAHAIAVSVSKNPGVSDYNPLFLYGSSGLGKTHLLHAIGNAFLKNFPKKKVLYTSSEEFTSDFISATKNNNFNVFRKKYRTVDLLLLDDIQFIDSTKEKTSEEIFHTYNALYNLKKQLVFSSDRAPSEILGNQ